MLDSASSSCSRFMLTSEGSLVVCVLTNRRRPRPVPSRTPLWHTTPAPLTHTPRAPARRVPVVVKLAGRALGELASGESIDEGQGPRDPRGEAGRRGRRPAGG